MKSQRQLQMGEAIKRAMSNIFMQDDYLKVAGSYMTISEADVSPDAKNVKIYIDIFGNAELHDTIIKNLNQLAPRFRHQIAKNVTLRVVPNLTFVLDKTQDNVASLEGLLQNETRKDNSNNREE